MKKVVMVWTMEFEDDVPDETCFKTAIEVQSQDRHWPDDDHIFIAVDDFIQLP